MTTAIERTPKHEGGYWLLEDTSPAELFTPERLSDEQRMMGRTALEFARNELLPNLGKLEAKDWSVARQLVKRCGDLGLLGTDAPEEYGGLALDKASAVVVAEGIAIEASFAVTFGAMTGLSIMPLVMFGTEEQRRRYLPGLISGELVGAYALSESGSGSDALGARARATVDPDGTFRLSGEKMWISNCNFADVYIVFAKVDGEQFSAFIVERSFPGVSTGAEEHKMGLLASSTASLILQDVRVPRDNLLGEIGKGHKVAFDVLNYGRLKLGAMCVGGAKAAVGEAARYATERRQFNRAIATFGAIKHKLGEMTIRTYAVESVLYRTAGLIQKMAEQIEADTHDSGAAARGALDNYSVEASITKVAGSETLDFVLDENVQIHGGNGYVHDYPAERHYRDARVNRIFEGTNEINRLLIPGMLIRKASKNELPLIPAAKRLLEEVLSPGLGELPGDDELDAERAAIASFKKVGLLMLGAAMQKYGKNVSEEQEVLTAIADICIDVFAAESVVLRALDASARGLAGADLHVAIARALVSDASARIDFAAKTALAAMNEGDALRTQLAALRRVLKVMPVNTVAIRRRLADATVAKGSYIFS
jgi:alkylation response protein AidB-like acyl-CoA dehydrogenase